MKTRTLVATGIMLFLCSILTAMHSSRGSEMPIAKQNPMAFNSIQIGEGIEVEFEYGQQLQVISQNGLQPSTTKMVLKNGTLFITNLAQTPVQLKVITPWLVSIERAPGTTEKQVAAVCKPCNYSEL
jgi:hypothetical protein